MTTANKISILRILLVPFFVTQVLYYIDTGEERFRFFAILSFAIAAISDGVDGYIARRYNQKTELGAILDPVADKLLMVSALVLLTFDHEPALQRIPIWCAGVVIGRDLIVAIGSALIYHTRGKFHCQPRLTGKATTVFLMALVLHTLLKWPGQVQRIWVWCAAACATVSCVQYLMDGMKQLESHAGHQSDKS